MWGQMFFIIEASYELGNKYQKRKLFNRKINLEIIPSIKSNGWRLIKHALVPYGADAYHHGAIHILEKETSISNKSKTFIDGNIFCCPRCKYEIEYIKSFCKCSNCSLV